jgi:hypothetical protein
LLFCGKNDVCNFANAALNPERQAEGFASDLILPTYMVDPRLRKTKRLTLAAARELADEFCTNLTATLFKMTVLMTIVCHNKERRRWFEQSKMIQPWWRGQGSGSPDVRGRNAVQRRGRTELSAEDAGGRLARFQRLRSLLGRGAVLSASQRRSHDCAEAT